MKIIYFLLMLFLFLYPIKTYAISAESYVVMDYDSKRVLLAKASENEKLIASTTKIMTCILALENGDLESERTVGEEVLNAFGSAIYLQIGEKMKLKDLLYGLMLRSGNDAAIEISYHIAGNMDNFVNLMNAKALEIGMNHTHFINPHGLENDKGDGNTSTAYDMALLMQYALKNETFKEIIHTKNYKTNTLDKVYVWQNKNKLLSTYEYQIGGKTGFTKKAKRTLVTASMKDNKTCIVVTLNDGNDFADHKNACEEVFDNYERVLLLDKDTFIVDEDNPTKYYINENLYALLKPEEKEKVKINLNVDNTSKEKIVGKAFVYLDDFLLGETDIFLNNDENKHKENFFVRFWRWLTNW